MPTGLNGLDEVLTLKREDGGWVLNARPLKLGEVHGLDWVGVGNRECVAGATVESILEVHDLGALGWLALHLKLTKFEKGEN